MTITKFSILTLGMLWIGCGDGAPRQDTGGPLTCELGKSVCDDGCVDTTSDPENCGGCAQSCGGGQCLGSNCQPLTIAAEQDSPCGLAIDTDNVYWTSGSIVQKAPIGGGQPVTLASNQTSPCGIAVDATNVYWVNAATSGQVMTVPIAGGQATTLADQQPRPFKLALSDGNLYWTNNAAGTVMKMPVTGGQPVQLVDKQPSPVAIFVDSDTVYWSSFGAQSIGKLPLAAGATAAPLATDQASPASIFVRNGKIYWTDDSRGQVLFTSVTGGDPQLVAASPGAYGLAVDNRSVYWTDDVSGNVMTVPLSGGTRHPLVTKQSTPTDLVMDDGFIYWINSATNGSVMKLAK